VSIHRRPWWPLAAAPVALAISVGASATTAPAVQRQARVVLSADGLSLSPRRLATVGDATMIVVFRIRNTSGVRRRFVVGSYRSPLIPSGAVRSYSVAFTRFERLTCRSVTRRGRTFSSTLTIARPA
jgi:hypothetical protein